MRGLGGDGGLSREVERKGVSPAVDSRRATPIASVLVVGDFLVSAQKGHVSAFRTYFLTVSCPMSNLAC